MLIIKHRRDEVVAMGLDPKEDWLLTSSESWIDSQRYWFLIDINLSGKWSGLDTRQMAEEAGCIDFYRFTYPQFSTVVHSTWNHISRYDLTPCTNPLHAHHKIPRSFETRAYVDFFILAAKYLAKTFNLIDSELKLDITAPSSYEIHFCPNQYEGL